MKHRSAKTLMQSFCSTNILYLDIREPFVIGRWIYATDGCIIIRVEKAQAPITSHTIDAGFVKSIEDFYPKANRTLRAIPVEMLRDLQPKKRSAHWKTGENFILIRGTLFQWKYIRKLIDVADTVGTDEVKVVKFGTVNAARASGHMLMRVKIGGYDIGIMPCRWTEEAESSATRLPL